MTYLFFTSNERNEKLCIKPPIRGKIKSYNKVSNLILPDSFKNNLWSIRVGNLLIKSVTDICSIRGGVSRNKIRK